MARRTRGSEFYEVDSGTVEIRWESTRATLFLEGVESSCIDTARPEELEFEYMQHMTCAAQCLFGADEPIRAIHLGGAACALPYAWSRLFPRSRQTAVEIDAALAAGVRTWFDLPRSPALAIRVGDAREVLDSLRRESCQIIVRDAFDAGRVPDHLATVECARIARDRLRDGGVYIVNAAHGAGEDARREAASLREVFPGVVTIADPKVGRSGRRGNVIIVAHKAPAGDYPIADLDRELRRLPLPARVTSGAALDKWCAGARPLFDAAPG